MFTSSVDSSLTTNLEPVRSIFADDPDFAELIEFFVDAMPERRQAIEAAIAEQDWEGLKVISHQLKGAGGGYGFDELSELAAELEIHCKSADLPAIATAAVNLLTYINRIGL